MGFFNLFGKKMSPQEAFDILLDGTASKAVLNKAAQTTNISGEEYMAPATALILLLKLEKGTDTYPGAYNSIMMSVLIGLEYDKPKCMVNAEKIIRKNQSFAKDIIEYAKSFDKNLHTIYLAYAYLHGWGVEVDRNTAMDYLSKAREAIDDEDKKSLTAIEKIEAELNS